MTGSLLTTRSLWYLARGTGVVSLVLLTAIVALGIGSRLHAPGRVPRFATAQLHRNLSLLVLAFLAVHIATSVLDPFAAISWTDAVLPLRASYRPIWLGLGALAFDLLIAIAITSLLRLRLGLAVWRNVHWFAYACWPIALVHGLGTGSDVRSRWMLGAVIASIVAVECAAVWRLSSVRLDRRVRVGLACAILLLPIPLGAWLAAGPLRHGWAARASIATSTGGPRAPTADPA